MNHEMIRGSRLRRWALAAMPLAMLPAEATSQQHFPSDASLAAMVHYLAEDGATPGIALGILDADGATRVFTAGRAGPDAGPVSARTIFEIGSITKTFTATLLAEMVRRGEVSVEDPVSRYLPGWVGVPSRNGREITLLDLATHRSGLPSIPANFFPPAHLGDPYGGYTIERLYEFLSGHELQRAPGAEAEYSNVGYGLLGHALARAVGVPLRDLVRERVLKPLGMKDTDWATESVSANRLAQGHKHGRVVPHWTTTEAFDGAGGLRSTVDDMLKFLDANLGPPETPLQAAMRDAHEYRRPFREGTGIGLAWMVEEHGDGALLRHGGSSAGFSALIAFDPAIGVGFVRLTNTGRFPDNTGLHFLRTGPPPAVQETEVPPEVLARYTGTYAMGPDTHFYVRLEDEGLLTAQGGPNTVRLRMYATSDSTFIVKRVSARLAFTRDATGAVDAMILGTRRLPRVADDTPAPGLPTVEILDLPLTAGDIARYEGDYVFRIDGAPVEARITGENRSLVARVGGGEATRLLHQGDHAFVLEADPDGRALFVVEDGRATAIRIRLAGAELAGQRRP